MVHPEYLRRLAWCALAAVLLLPGLAAASVEQTFDVLQIGTRTYTNVTVTTKAPTYIYMLYAGGMGNFKVKDLSPELRAQLGYDAGARPGAAVSNATTWARQTLSKIDAPQMRQMGQQLGATWRQRVLAPLMRPGLIRSWTAQAALGITVVLYLFFCNCCKLICEKTGLHPGPLVWVPVFQAIPLLNAAKMSYWWLLAGLVPVLNLAPCIVWSFKIAKARGKGAGVGLLLLLPPLNLLAFLYLAFAGGPPVRQSKQIRIMALETA